MEYYRITDGPSLRVFELAFLGDKDSKPAPVIFDVHTHDEQGNGLSLGLSCLIESCGRINPPQSERWNFIGTTPNGLRIVGQFSTKTRRGELHEGKPEEFGDVLRVETQDELAFHGNAHAKIQVYLGEILISSITAKVCQEKGADDKYYPVVKLTKTDHSRLPQ